METHSYEEAKKTVFKGMLLLGAVTLLEVFIALYGKGYILNGYLPTWLMYLLMIGLSMYKAYFIVFEFMHMRYELRGLVLTVLLPTTLLIWALIAFMAEGGYWERTRMQIEEKDEIELNNVVKPIGADKEEVRVLD